MLIVPIACYCTSRPFWFLLWGLLLVTSEKDHRGLLQPAPTLLPAKQTGSADAGTGDLPQPYKAICEDTHAFFKHFITFCGWGLVVCVCVCVCITVSIHHGCSPQYIKTFTTVRTAKLLRSFVVLRNHLSCAQKLNYNNECMASLTNCSDWATLAGATVTVHEAKGHFTWHFMLIFGNTQTSLQRKFAYCFPKFIYNCSQPLPKDDILHWIQKSMCSHFDIYLLKTSGVQLGLIDDFYGNLSQEETEGNP